MKYCANCGKELADNAAFCSECGAAQQAPVDGGSFGWAVLGFCFPLVGLILYLVWKNNKPFSAKKAGMGALIGFILNLILTFIGGLA